MSAPVFCCSPAVLSDSSVAMISLDAFRMVGGRPSPAAMSSALELPTWVRVGSGLGQG